MVLTKGPTSQILALRMLLSNVHWQAAWLSVSVRGGGKAATAHYEQAIIKNSSNEFVLFCNSSDE